MLFTCLYLSLFQLISLLANLQKSLWGGIKMFLGYYLLFHALYLAYNSMNGTNLTLNRVLTPSFGIWYILSLCYWRCLPQFFSKPMIRYPWLFICGSFILSIGVGFISLDSQMSFQRTFIFLPFFILGFYAKLYNWVEQLKQISVYIILVAIILVALVTIVYIYCPPFYGNRDYSEISDCWIRCLQIVL